MKKQLLLLVMILLPMMANADAVEIDGIWYNLITKGKIAEVIKNPNGYNITGSLIIPASVTYDGEEYSVTRIVDSEEAGYWNGVFANCSMTSVSLPNSLTRIGRYAFAGCSSLTDFTIPDGVKEIGEASFYVSGITSISIPNSVITIEEEAFRDCYQLNSIYINDLEAWCKISFKGSSFTNAPFVGTLASNYTDYHLFLNGEEIKDLVIPNSITSIGSNTFYGCIGLTSVIIPEGITSIGSSAFWGCNNLKSITIPKTVSSIDSDAFRFCNNLTGVHISDLEAWCQISFGGSIQDYWLISNPLFYAHHLFFNGEEIKDLVIPSSITNISSFVFYGCSGLSSITIPSNVATIGDGAFYGCSGLMSINIPNSVTSIGESAFYECSNIKSLAIGKSVNFIGRKAFAACKELTDVYCFAENVPKMKYEYTPTWTDIFENSYIEYATLHVPAESIEVYKSTEPWNNFKEIVKTMPVHNLTYMVDDKTYKKFLIEEGTTIIAEPSPTKEGYTFSGWSEIPETMPAHDVTVTGSFTINKYKLIYMVDNTEYNSYDVEYGATITPEVEPTKEGYTFSGWSEIPETMPAHDVTVTGSFTVNQYTITYIIDNEVYTTQTVDYGSTIVPPTIPEHEGYDFAWADYPETMPAYDITIYGTYTTGIEAIMAGEIDCQMFSLDGKPLNELQTGVNIVRMSNGQVRKVVVR